MTTKFVKYAIKTDKNRFKIVEEKEHYILDDFNTTPSIGAVIMVKNETKRIKITLESLTGIVDCVIVYDTGSTDNTMNIIKHHCMENKINLYMIQGIFENFSVSRNVLLDYADTINVKFLLLFDVNDELQGGIKLKKFCYEHLHTENTAYLTCQHWWSGQYDKYFNIRLVKNKTGWRYFGAVHEWIKDTNIEGPESTFPVFRMPDDIFLYQDRTQDDDKTGKRFLNDKVLLLQDYKEDSTNTRTVFYLAQTYACLKQNTEAFYFYKIRTTLDGFQEEIFHSLLRCGELSQQLNHNWYESLQWYIKAFEHSPRVEPLIKITEYYKNQKNWLLAFMFVNLACELTFPEHCILFVNKRSYDYTRWHLLGIIAFYVNKFKEGKIGCIKAIEQNVNKDLDTQNLNYYIQKEIQSSNSNDNITNVTNTTLTNASNLTNTTNLTKKEYINKKMSELKQKHPMMSLKQLQSISLKNWKKTKKNK